MEQKEIGLSERELKRHGVLERLKTGGLSQVDAAREMGLSTRQVRRLQRRLEVAGPAGLRSARRGGKPNNWIDGERRAAAAALLREHYRDFGPTLACQMLAERHGQVFSVETTRTLMREAGLWRAKRRSVRFHPPRARRPRLGELVQIDGSPHDWFEGRAPRCSLLVFVDDATSRIQAARFVAGIAALPAIAVSCHDQRSADRPEVRAMALVAIENALEQRDLADAFAVPSAQLHRLRPQRGSMVGCRRFRGCHEGPA